MHNANEVLLGHVPSSDKVITNFAGDPAVMQAGLAPRVNSSNQLSLTHSDGGFAGVSVGESLDQVNRVAVCREGNDVPIQLTDEGEFASIEKGDLTFTAKAKGTAGNSLTVAFLDDEDAADIYAEFDGTDLIIHGESTVNTAQEIVDAIEASEDFEDLDALMSVAIAEGEEAAAQTAFAEDALEGGLESYPYVTVGQLVKISNTTGKAASTGTTSAAIYNSGALDGITPGAASKKVAKINMGGGL